MREYAIRVSSIDFVSFESITINREINHHTQAIVVGCIPDDMADTYTSTLLTEFWVTIESIGESDKWETLLEGIVTDFSISHEPHMKVLAMTIHSGSYLLDVAPHFRTFQDADITYDDVLAILEEKYADADHLEAALATNTINDFLMQYQETDWMFIVRLASRLNYYVSPADRFTGIRYYFGPRERKEICFPQDYKYTLHKYSTEYLDIESAKEIPLNENDCLEFVVNSRDDYRIGDWAYILGIQAFVYKVESRYEQGEMLHRFYMRTSRGLATLHAYNQTISGCSFNATVREVKEDMIRIDVCNDENAQQEVVKWFRYSTVYSTPDGTGWYCMPEIGDVVRLHIPSKREYDGYVISSIHLDISGDDRKNPNYKSIMNKYRKEILFTPDKLVLTNNNGMKIEIADGEGINIISNKSIHISAEDSVALSSKNASMVVVGTDAVSIKQNGAGIDLDDDVIFRGGEFRIQ